MEKMNNSFQYTLRAGYKGKQAGRLHPVKVQLKNRSWGHRPWSHIVRHIVRCHWMTYFLYRTYPRAAQVPGVTWNPETYAGGGMGVGVADRGGVEGKVNYRIRYFHTLLNINYGQNNTYNASGNFVPYKEETTNISSRDLHAIVHSLRAIFGTKYFNENRWQTQWYVNPDIYCSPSQSFLLAGDVGLKLHEYNHALYNVK